jgi:hypothetical protein
MNVGSVHSGNLVMAHPVKLTVGKTYYAGVWVMASTPTLISVGIRTAHKPNVYFGQSSITGNMRWQYVEFNAKIKDNTDPFLLFCFESSGSHVTLWMDDAWLEEAKS